MLSMSTIDLTPTKNIKGKGEQEQINICDEALDLFRKALPNSSFFKKCCIHVVENCAYIRVEEYEKHDKMAKKQFLAILEYLKNLGILEFDPLYNDLPPRRVGSSMYTKVNSVAIQIIDINKMREVIKNIPASYLTSVTQSDKYQFFFDSDEAKQKTARYLLAEVFPLKEDPLNFIFHDLELVKNIGFIQETVNHEEMAEARKQQREAVLRLWSLLNGGASPSAEFLENLDKEVEKNNGTSSKQEDKEEIWHLRTKKYSTEGRSAKETAQLQLAFTKLEFFLKELEKKGVIILRKISDEEYLFEIQDRFTFRINLLEAKEACEKEMEKIQAQSAENNNNTNKENNDTQNNTVANIDQQMQRATRRLGNFTPEIATRIAQSETEVEINEEQDEQMPPSFPVAATIWHPQYFPTNGEPQAQQIVNIQTVNSNVANSENNNVFVQQDDESAERALRRTQRILRTVLPASQTQESQAPTQPPLQVQSEVLSEQSDEQTQGQRRSNPLTSIGIFAEQNLPSNSDGLPSDVFAAMERAKKAEEAFNQRRSSLFENSRMERARNRASELLIMKEGVTRLLNGNCG